MRPGLLLIVLLAVVTYLTRAPLLIWLGRRNLPGWLERCFAALPITILTALAVPLVVLPEGRLAGPFRPEIVGAVLAAVVARYTGNLLVPVAVAVVVVACLRAVIRLAA